MWQTEIGKGPEVDATCVGVVFDFDGTLVDSLKVWKQLETEMSQRAGVVLTQAESKALTTFSIGECAQFFHARLGLADTVDDVVDMMSDFMLDYYRNRVSACAGALSFVKALAERGVHMSVASSSPQAYLQAGLSRCGLLPYFDAVVSVDDVGKPKRYPDVWHRARTLMGTPLASTWGVEDSSYALRVLRDAGYRTLGVYNGKTSGIYEEFSQCADHAFIRLDEVDVDTFLAWSVS